MISRFVEVLLSALVSMDLLLSFLAGLYELFVHLQARKHAQRGVVEERDHSLCFWSLSFLVCDHFNYYMKLKINQN